VKLHRFAATLTMALTLLATLSCSKTADTSPATGLYGDPPVIQQASITAPRVTVSCDFTDVAQYFNRHIPSFDGGLEIPDIVVNRPFLISSTFSEVQMTATITDAQNTPDQSNILTVTGSYLLPGSGTDAPKEETTVIMLDDGGTNTFQYGQASTMPEDCTTDMMGNISCDRKTYNLTSNDATADDGRYTRYIAFIKPALTQAIDILAKDCIVAQRHDTFFNGEKIGDAGSTLTFKLEVTDREGNLTTWPQSMTVTSGETVSECSGDPCLCCILQGDFSQCHGKDGLISPSQAPNGVCYDML
jgi:hypothetical protein